MQLAYHIDTVAAIGLCNPIFIEDTNREWDDETYINPSFCTSWPRWFWFVHAMTLQVKHIIITCLKLRESTSSLTLGTKV